MQRHDLGVVTSSALLLLVILGLPDVFLFSKTVPTSFWTEYFPLPFGAGWVLMWFVWGPAVWLSQSPKAAINGSFFALPILLLAVPIALLLRDQSLSMNALINQYMWVAIVCLPPVALHCVVFCLFCWLKARI